MQLSVVLMQDAVRLATPLPGQVYRLQDGHSDLGPGDDRLRPSCSISIFAADSVVTW